MKNTAIIVFAHIGSRVTVQAVEVHAGFRKVEAVLRGLEVGAIGALEAEWDNRGHTPPYLGFRVCGSATGQDVESAVRKFSEAITRALGAETKPVTDLVPFVKDLEKRGFC